MNKMLVSSLPQQKQAQSVADEKRSKPKECGVGDPPVVGVCEQRVVFGEVFLTQRAAKYA